MLVGLPGPQGPAAHGRGPAGPGGQPGAAPDADLHHGPVLRRRSSAAAAASAPSRWCWWATACRRPLRERLATQLTETGFFSADLGRQRRGRRAWCARARSRRRWCCRTISASASSPGEDVAIALWKDPGSPLKSGIVEQILQRLLARYQAGEAAYLALWPEDGFEAAGRDELDLPRTSSTAGFSAAWQRWRSRPDDPAPARGRRALPAQRRPPAGPGPGHADASRWCWRSGTRRPPAPAGRTSTSSTTSCPASPVFFLMFGVAAGARDIHRERERGTLQRQLLTPVTRPAVPAGQVGGRGGPGRDPAAGAVPGRGPALPGQPGPGRLVAAGDGGAVLHRGGGVLRAAGPADAHREGDGQPVDGGGPGLGHARRQHDAHRRAAALDPRAWAASSSTTGRTWASATS